MVRECFALILNLLKPLMSQVPQLFILHLIIFPKALLKLLDREKTGIVLPGVEPITSVLWQP